MDYLKKLNEAEVTTEYNDDTQSVLVTITYNGKPYSGFAITHDDDADFYSPKVGKYIAHCRARIAVLKDLRDRAKNRWTKIAIQKYPVQSSRQYFESLSNYLKIRDRLRQEQKDLYHYLKEQDFAIKVVKNYRAKKAAAAEQANND